MKNLFYAMTAGFLSGLSATLFLVSLFWVDHLRLLHPLLVCGLPFAGLLIGLVYEKYGRDVRLGTHLIIDEIHEPKKVIPLRMAPMIYASTLLTHLCGGSAGREGTAVQIGVALSDQISHPLKILPAQRRTLLLCSTGAALGAVVGAPFAGIFFGVELLNRGKIWQRPAALLECAIASFTAFAVTRILHAPHPHYPNFSFGNFGLPQVLGMVLCICVFVLLTRGFIFLTHWIEKTQAQWVSFAPLRPFLGGIILLALYLFFSWGEFEGLGLPTIEAAFQTPANRGSSLIKLLVTAITLGSGYKGGEFIPLVFMGTTSGSAIAGLLNIPPQLFASLGFVAPFAAAAKVPFSCSLMAIELFGWPIAPYAIFTCFLSTWLSGKKGIYR